VAGAQDEGQRLVYAIDGEITQLNNANSDVPTAAATAWLYSALYTYDDTLTPVPDLAAEPAEISEDGLTWTIKLVKNATFQPTGDKLTADDVVFTYKMSNSPNCRFNPSICLAFVTVTPEGATEPVPVLQSVEKVDDYTVRFVLADKYAPFLTTVLPATLIDSRKAVTDAFGKFSKDVEKIDAAKVADLLTRIQAERDAAATEERDADLAQFRVEVEEFLEGVDHLRDDADRLEARLARLEASRRATAK
jgi:ABC-type transport system substrate-binding protein